MVGTDTSRRLFPLTSCSIGIWTPSGGTKAYLLLCPDRKQFVVLLAQDPGDRDQRGGSSSLSVNALLACARNQAAHWLRHKNPFIDHTHQPLCDTAVLTFEVGFSDVVGMDFRWPLTEEPRLVLETATLHKRVFGSVQEVCSHYPPARPRRQRLSAHSPVPEEAGRQQQQHAQLLQPRQQGMQAPRQQRPGGAGSVAGEGEGGSLASMSRAGSWASWASWAVGSARTSLDASALTSTPPATTATTAAAAPAAASAPAAAAEGAAAPAAPALCAAAAEGQAAAAGDAGAAASSSCLSADHHQQGQQRGQAAEGACGGPRRSIGKLGGAARSGNNSGSAALERLATLQLGVGGSSAAAAAAADAAGDATPAHGHLRVCSTCSSSLQTAEPAPAAALARLGASGSKQAAASGSAAPTSHAPAADGMCSTAGHISTASSSADSTPRAAAGASASSQQKQESAPQQQAADSAAAADSMPSFGFWRAQQQQQSLRQRRWQLQQQQQQPPSTMGSSSSLNLVGGSATVPNSMPSSPRTGSSSPRFGAQQPDQLLQQLQHLQHLQQQQLDVQQAAAGRTPASGGRRACDARSRLAAAAAAAAAADSACPLCRQPLTQPLAVLQQHFHLQQDYKQHRLAARQAGHRSGGRAPVPRSRSACSLLQLQQQHQRPQGHTRAADDTGQSAAARARTASPSIETAAAAAATNGLHSSSQGAAANRHCKPVAAAAAASGAVAAAADGSATLPELSSPGVVYTGSCSPEVCAVAPGEGPAGSSDGAAAAAAPQATPAAAAAAASPAQTQAGGAGEGEAGGSLHASYSNRTVVLTFVDPTLPYQLTKLVKSDANVHLLKLYESGLPAWAVVLPSYGLWYRPWLRRVTWLLFVLLSVVSMAMGFYDLWKNVPYFKVAVVRMFRPAAAVFEWLEGHTQIRLSILLTYMVGKSQLLVQVVKLLTHASLGPLLAPFAPLASAASAALSALRLLLRPVFAALRLLLGPVGRLLWLLLTVLWQLVSTLLWFGPLQLVELLGSGLLAGLQLLLLPLQAVLPASASVRAGWSAAKATGQVARSAAPVVAGAARGAAGAASSWWWVWWWWRPLEALEIMRVSTLRVARALQAVLRSLLALAATINKHRHSLTAQLRGKVWGGLQAAAHSPAGRVATVVAAKMGQGERLQQVQRRVARRLQRHESLALVGSEALGGMGSLSGSASLGLGPLDGSGGGSGGGAAVGYSSGSIGGGRLSGVARHTRYSSGGDSELLSGELSLLHHPVEGDGDGDDGEEVTSSLRWQHHRHQLQQLGLAADGSGLRLRAAAAAAAAGGGGEHRHSLTLTARQQQAMQAAWWVPAVPAAFAASLAARALQGPQGPCHSSDVGSIARRSLQASSAAGAVPGSYQVSRSYEQLDGHSLLWQQVQQQQQQPGAGRGVYLPHAAGGACDAHMPGAGLLMLPTRHAAMPHQAPGDEDVGGGTVAASRLHLGL